LEGDLPLVVDGRITETHKLAITVWGYLTDTGEFNESRTVGQVERAVRLPESETRKVANESHLAFVIDDRRLKAYDLPVRVGARLVRTICVSLLFVARKIPVVQDRTVESSARVQMVASKATSPLSFNTGRLNPENTPLLSGMD
jgi:hypothetical protein